MNSIEKKRFYQIDFLYTIGIAFVLIGHSHSSDGSYSGTLLQSVISFIYVFHMPLFFAIAGFLFMNSDALEKRGFGKWIGDKASRLLIPYFFWSLIGLVPKYYFENKGFSGLNAVYLVKIFFVPRQSVWGHFWFLPILFLVYVIFGFLKKVLLKKPEAAFPIVISVIIVVYFLPVRIGILGIDDICKFSVYFVGGMIARYITEIKKPFVEKIKKHKRSLLVLGTVIIIVNAITAHYALSIKALGLLMGVLMVGTCCVTSLFVKEYRFTKWVGSHNLAIYIFSWFFQSVMMTVCDHMHAGWIITFFLMLAAGVTGPLLVIIIFERIPFLNHQRVKLLFGLR